MIPAGLVALLVLPLVIGIIAFLPEIAEWFANGRWRGL